MEEKIISEEQLEIMRHKARKRQNIAIVLTFLAFVLYIGMFYVALIEKEGMSVLFVVKIVFAAAVLAIVTFGCCGTSLSTVLMRNLIQIINPSMLYRC